MTRIALVVAVAENGVIGDRGALPWRIADDLKWFKAVTIGKPVVMGRKTYQSIGKALPGRRNIVVTRDSAFRADGVERASSLDDALRLALAAASDLGADEIAVIGGADIYAQALPFADRIYLTRVAARPEGDTHLPALDPAAWRTTDRGGAAQDWDADRGADGAVGRGRNQYACRFYVLDRIGSAEVDNG